MPCCAKGGQVMDMRRRSFLKMMGVCALGLGVLPVVETFAETL